MMRIVHIYYFLVLFFTLRTVQALGECSTDAYNFAGIQQYDPWISASDGINKYRYKISVCTPLKQNGADDHGCHADTSVCMDLGNGTKLSAGNSTVHSITQNNETGDIWYITAGDVCPEQPLHNLTTSINFKCGPLIGSPKLLAYSYCVNYFEWESHIFCKGEKPDKDVPCYLYDDQNNRYDLSPLAKRKDGYLVSSEMDTDVFINVCRDIKPETMAQGCEGAGACKKTKDKVTKLGFPTQALKRSSNGILMLYYTTPTKDYAIPSACTSPPSTTISFICPKRGGSKDPLLINDFDCQYVIEWETEYACPEATLTNTSCVLTKASADIDIDLRPLTKAKGCFSPNENDQGVPIVTSGDNYAVDHTDSSGIKYRYFINVCEELNIPCPDSSHQSLIGACQTKPGSEHFGQIMGKSSEKILRYADNRLTLTYKGGNKCNHNNFKRTTVIEFICQQDASDNGRGAPEFHHEDECIYYFEWKTKYACLDHPVNEECRVNNNGSRFDLSSLVRTHDGNWLGLHDNNDEFGTGQYFINVCHDVLQEQGASQCDPGAAICYRDASKGFSRSLGRYEQNPVYITDSKTLQLQYTSGDTCGPNKQISSTIYFICKTGELQSGPVLTHVSNDNCFYDFEWHTAAACALGNFEGNDCKVEDTKSGISFDLTPLKKASGSYYTVKAGSHDFLINVCGPVSGSKCDTLAGVTGVGICQVPAGGADGAMYSAGAWSSKLLYFDGMINLTYSDGTPYHDNAKTPRKSEITFLCDPDAGVGEPKYLDEIASEHYYGFEWRTKYACPVQPMECTAVGGDGQEYDLSKLTQGSVKGNWILPMPYEKKKFHLNVCRNLNRVHVTGGCSTFASACTTSVADDGTEVVDVADYGHIKSGLMVEGPGRLNLTYKGQRCNSTTNYTTTIHFICRKDALVSHPDEPMKNGDCDYSIIWNTAAACSVSTPEVTERCTIKDNGTNYVYNLQPLRKQPGEGYSVKVGDLEFKLNICGKLSSSICGGGNASACQIKSDGTKEKIADGNQYLLEFNGDGRLAMSYEGARLLNGDRVKVLIDFQCQQGSESGEPEFMRHERDTYMFRFLTALACRPATVDCLVQSPNGDQYNLGALSRDEGWTVLDTRDHDTKYYINVCKPVNDIPGCPDEPIGGCQYASNKHYHNIGYVQSKPLARDDGSLTITYRNGDICHKGTPNEAHRSSRINFYCSATEEGPVFMTETDMCEYVFSWRTQAACKLQSSKGHDCTAIDPVYNFMFNLNPLRKNGSDYHVHSGNEEFVLNVCGPLEETIGESCKSSSGVGACMRKHEDPTITSLSIGKGNSAVTYSSGELSLVYKDGNLKCQTTIKFTCDYNKDGLDGPIFIERTRDCDFIFEWATSYACTPYKVGSCYVADSAGNNYDLSSLTLSHDNYETTENTNNGMKKFIFNVCHSLVHKANATCAYNAAACMVDLSKPDDDKDKYINIGEVNSNQVQFKEGHLVLSYVDGSPCEGGHMKTYIEFVCNKDSKNTNPTGHFMEGSCTHHFLWSSAAACPIQPPPKPEKPTNNTQGGQLTCQTTNPTTGGVFDLSRLKVLGNSKPWYVNDTSGHRLEFNVCGPLTGSKCTNASSLMGVCQSEYDGQKRTFNAGDSVNDLYFEDMGIAVLNYTGGDRCHNGQYQRNTIITFVCNNHQGLGRPVYLDEMSDCTYYISWHTDLLCERQYLSKCTVTTDDFHTIDLSPLTRHPDNIVHSSEGGALYYLSICSPLTPVSGIMCPPGAGACLVKGGSGKKHISLGRPRSPPIFVPSTKQVNLIYTNGSTCDFDPTQNFTTKILLTCLPGPYRNEPRFVEKVGCQYVFEWQTSVVCYKKEPDTPTDTCSFHDYETGMDFDFTTLSKGDHYYTTTDSDKNKYYINPCKAVSKSGCGEGMVCRESGSNLLSMGAPKQYSFERVDSNIIKMTYASGGTCPDGTKASSEILFECNREEGNGQPKYFTGIHCSIQFIWETSLVCPQIVQPCTLVDNGHLYDLTLLSKDNGAWSLKDSKGNSYWINICASLNTEELRRSCGRNAGACRKSKYGYEMIGSVTAQKSLHKDSKTGALVLEYGQGGNVCSHDRRRTDNQAATTRINFICGDTYGGPVFNESALNKEKCLFEFTWKTKMACKVEREEVQANNGIIFDSHSGGSINLQPLLHKNYSYVEQLASGDRYTYEIRLDGKTAQCLDGAVCLIRAEKSRMLLGSYASRKFYIDDESLEAVYTTNQKCKNTFSKINVTSIIQFHCNVKINDTGSPVLLSRSKDCVYIFSWDTPQACLTAQVIQPTVINTNTGGGGDKSGTSSSSSSASKGGTKSKTVATVVGVFIVAIALCVLVVVFHKSERRAACIGGMRRLIGRRSSEYTQLPTAATDDFAEEDEIDEVVTVTDAAETETNRDEEPFVHVSQKTYHDDSDEDMLL